MKVVAAIIIIFAIGGAILVTFRHMRSNGAQRSKPTPNVLQAPVRFPENSQHGKPDMLIQLFSFA